MNRIEALKNLFTQSSLFSVLSIKKEDDYPERNYSSLRFNSNEYRIRALEIWQIANGDYLRIYHGSKIATELKSDINNLEGQFRSTQNYSDFKGDFEKITKSLFDILSNEELIEIIRKNPVFSRNTDYYEGLELPDVDTSDDEIMGKIFSWKELIAINEDTSSDNKLKQALSQCGVYLQRSLDGKSRYVGSAFSDGGILARWITHLTRNGHAKHLNLFVLENGYNNVCFSVLEITNQDDALNAEARWKTILGSKNTGAYDGFRLNSN